MPTHPTSNAPQAQPLPATAIIAALWRRFAAMAYDGLTLLGISMAYGALVTLLGVAIYGAPSESSPNTHYQSMFQTGGTSELVMLGWVTCMVGFYVFFWQRSGQTLGMRAWRLKVVDEHNPLQRLSWVRCTQRAAWGFLSLALAGAGYWYLWFNRRQQCLHDQLTQTCVVVIPK